VKHVAASLQLPVLQPERARKPEFIDELRGHAPDLIVVAAYGQILPPALLDLPRYGAVNVHTSLLPRHRGAAPIQWAILEGDAVTGVTIMKMDAGLDTGAILTQSSTPIGPEDNAHTLHDRLAAMGAELLVQTLPGLVSGTIVSRPQPAEGVTYARKIKKEDGRLDWTRPAQALWNQVRGLVPWPGAYTFLPGQKGSLLKVWESEVVPQTGGEPGAILQADPGGLVVACGQGALRLLSVQREGGRRMSSSQFLLGHPLPPGERFAPGIGDGAG
jgi:methionyl-tRNA formyltransferase